MATQWDLARDYLLTLPEVRAWAHRAYNGGPLGWNHGHNLQHALWRLGGHSEAEKVLRYMVAEGWIAPVKYCPTVEQRFFSTGQHLPQKKWAGVEWPDPDVFKRPPKLMLVSPIEFSFRPMLECSAFVAYAMSRSDAAK